ncbi:MAG: hypothetical protein WD971_14280, partial [Pirellulales bacterium]
TNLPMHTIRLRGPWQLEAVYRCVPRADGGFERSTENLPAAARMHVPADWGAAFGSDFLGRVRYVRNFNSPLGLQFDERVWLVVEPQRSEARVVMLEETLGVVAADGPPRRFDVTHRLSPHNRLEIFVDHPALVDGRRIAGDPALLPPPGGLVGEVRLEIEAVR